VRSARRPACRGMSAIGGENTKPVLRVRKDGWGRMGPRGVGRDARSGRAEHRRWPAARAARPSTPHPSLEGLACGRGRGRSPDSRRGRPPSRGAVALQWRGGRSGGGGRAVHAASRLSQWRGRAGVTPASKYVALLAPSVVGTTVVRSGGGGKGGGAVTPVTVGPDGKTGCYDGAPGTKGPGAKSPGRHRPTRPFRPAGSSPAGSSPAGSSPAGAFTGGAFPRHPIFPQCPPPRSAASS